MAVKGHPADPESLRGAQRPPTSPTARPVSTISARGSYLFRLAPCAQARTLSCSQAQHKVFLTADELVLFAVKRNLRCHHVPLQRLLKALSCFQKQTAHENSCAVCWCGIRQRPILPGRHQPGTFGAEKLNFCVRDGNRWDLLAIVTGNCLDTFRTLKTSYWNAAACAAFLV